MWAPLLVFTWCSLTTVAFFIATLNCFSRNSKAATSQKIFTVTYTVVSLVVTYASTQILLRYL